MKNAIVEIYLAEMPTFKADANAPRKFCSSFAIEAEDEEHAAELAFHITNAPEEVLSDEHVQLAQEHYKSNNGVHARSLSVGDSVVVNINNVRTELICDSIGWIKA